VPFCSTSFFVDIDLGLLFFFAVSSLGVYGIILSGWSSNSRYAFFGALRSAAQLVSYEVSIGLILVSILLSVGSLNFNTIVSFQSFVFFSLPFFPLLIMFLISILAETNRAPFDLPEAESELVSGYNVEYAAMGFALFFLAEYSAMILMSGLTVIMFFGG
jgi:NADH-quinone oxidoreductase subunit H